MTVTVATLEDGTKNCRNKVAVYVNDQLFFQSWSGGFFKTFSTAFEVRPKVEYVELYNTEEFPETLNSYEYRYSYEYFLQMKEDLRSENYF